MIWVVTEQATTQEALVSLVSSKGYAAETINCVEDVHKRAKFGRPTLLIIDCGVRYSFDLVTEMRSDPFTKRIPLIMFTTSNEDFREEAMQRGADAFVLKRSLDWAELWQEIERLVGLPPRARQR